MDRRRFVAGATATALAASASASNPAGNPAGRSHNVVLVHGAYCDGSSWSAVIPRLEAAGLNESVVQNPLRSLDEDCACARRILAMQEGPTVLVGHSYAGQIITQIGDDPKVSALVYVAARASDAGEDYAALAKDCAPAPASTGLVHFDGFVQLSRRAFLDDFANGVEPATARTLYAVQAPITEALFTGKVTRAAWRSKPSFYAVSRQDRMMNPDIERFFAKRMGARTVELDSGHLSLVSHSRDVSELIVRAAAGTGRSGT